MPRSRLGHDALRSLATLAVSLFASYAVAQQGGLVLLQRTVNAKYDPASAQTQALLESNLAKSYLIKPGDNPQKILSEQFGVGPTALPNLYEGLTKKIQTLNGVSDLSGLQAGKELAIPDLPPYQWKAPVAGNPNYGLPRTQGGPTYSEALREATRRLPSNANAWRIFDTSRRAEPLVNQWRWVTVAQAKAELDALGTAVSLTVWSQPITVRFADATVGASGISTAGDIEFVSALLKKRAPSQDVVLFVLDDSWPSDALFDSSREFVVKAIDVVRQKYYLGPSNLDKTLRSAAAKTDFPIQASGRTSHAELVATSIADFTKLSGRVKVVYLPLFTEQKWGKDIWQELTQIALAASALHSSLGAYGPTQDITNRATVDAKDLVAQIPSKVVDALGPAQQTPITVLEKFAQLYAQATGVPFFISMSWTVEKYDIEFGPDPDSLGVTLAATGNDKKDVVKDAVYLASRAKAAPGDIVAVMNTDNTGNVLCGSGTLPVNGGNTFYGFAYDGRFKGDASKCGTSFSTPRVAWMLALREAFNSPIPSASWSSWYGSYRSSLVSLQDATKSDNGRYWLSIPRLFAGL
jgi:hypothetical protein